MVSVNGMNVFISGPMSGKPDWNRKAFADAEKRLEELGARLIYNPAAGAPKGEDAHGHEYWMRKALRELTASRNGDAPRYDYLVQLDGHLFSRGARLEARVAPACGIEVVPFSAVG